VGRGATLTVFELDVFRGAPSAFHALALLDAPEPLVLVCEPDRDAVVLGSSQRVELVDAAACASQGLEVAQRRSGGGAVLVEQGAMCWFDVVVPAEHPGFASVAADVTASMVWLGRHVAAALESLGIAGTAVHDAPMQCTPWSRLVCFAGTGAGEVHVAAGKLVGVSQRRRRLGSRFQCMVHTAWNPARLLGVLHEPRPGLTDLPAVATVDAEVAAALPRAVTGALNA
jgi:lipoate-protein ligase A